MTRFLGSSARSFEQTKRRQLLRLAREWVGIARDHFVHARQWELRQRRWGLSGRIHWTISAEHQAQASRELAFDALTKAIELRDRARDSAYVEVR